MQIVYHNRSEWQQKIFVDHFGQEWCTSPWLWYNGLIRKQDWGGHGGCLPPPGNYKLKMTEYCTILVKYHCHTVRCGIIGSIALVVRGSNPTLGAWAERSANRTKALHPAEHVGEYAWSIISCGSMVWQPPKNNPEYRSTTCHDADSMRKWRHWCIFTSQHCRTKVFHPRKVILSLYLPYLPQCAILQRYAYGSVCSTMVLHGTMVYYVCITSDAGVMLWFTTTISLYDHRSVWPSVLSITHCGSHQDQPGSPSVLY